MSEDTMDLPSTEVEPAGAEAKSRGSLFTEDQQAALRA